MARVSYLKRVGATYYARIDVPLDLVEIAKTSTKKKSLRTKDENEAKRLLWPVIAAWQREFDDMRLRRDITDDDKAQAVWQHYTAELQRDDETRQQLPTASDIEAATTATIEKIQRDGTDINDPLAILDAGLELRVMKSAGAYDAQRRKILADTMRKHLATGETALIEHEVDAYILENKLLIERGSPKYRDLCQRLQRAGLEALERGFERDRGDFGGTPKDPIVKPVYGAARPRAKPGQGMLDLFEQYAKENPKGIKADTFNQARRDIGLFVETVGNIPVSTIGKEHVREWKALLLDYPVKALEIAAFRGMTMREVIKANEKIGKPKISNRTVNRYLGALGAFCDWLVRNGYLDQNPTTGMHQNDDESKQPTQTFTADQMNTLFASPLFTGCLNDSDWHKPGNHQIRDHRYWLPLVMLYSGARPAEIAQLLVADVRQHHGQWIIHVTIEGGGDKSVKTKGSMRVIPVHPELIKLGFIDFRNRMEAQGESRIFPEAKRNSRGQMAADFSRDFSRYLKRLKIKTGRGLSLYSFRHGFVDALRRAEYLDEQFGFLIGHARATTTGRYGQIPQGMLRQRIEMVEKVEYPKLDLSRLKT